MKVELNSTTDSGAVLTTPPIAENCDLKDCDEQIRRILDSSQFSSSRRLSDFLLFAAQAAKEKRTEVDQYEVAEQVLHRDGDFNPLDDASVRKLASQVRHKLDEYYRAEGDSDSILISLPRRSYVLRFRMREDAAATRSADAAERATEPGAAPAVGAREPNPAVANQSVEAPSRDAEAAIHTHVEMPAPLLERPSDPVKIKRVRGIGVLVALGSVIMVILCTALGFWAGKQSGEPQPSPVVVRPEPGRVEIESQKGDLRGSLTDFQAGAVLTGPVLDGDGDVSVQMRFLPQHATQQAGLMLFVDPDNYVRIGSHFKTRSMLEIGHESEGKYAMWKSAYRYDPLAQAGLPLWLSLRRSGNTFQGFISRDGFNWESYGDVQNPATLLKDLRVAIYAFNGRTDIPSATAEFSSLASGLRFYQRPSGRVDPSAYPGWSLDTRCANPNLVSIVDGVLEVAFPDDSLCSTLIARSLPPDLPSEWAFSVHMDFLPVAGSSAGLFIQGERATLRLVRRDLNGGSIMLERDVDRDVRVADYPGAPPIHLRLSASDGIIRASYSRDGVHFETIPAEISLNELGAVRSYGANTSLSHWLQAEPRPAARFYAIEQDVLHLKPVSANPRAESLESVSRVTAVRD